LRYFGEGQDLDDLKLRLSALVEPGGLMDARDPLVTTTNPLDGNRRLNPDNPNEDMTVGFTFLGQSIDHDVTLDEAELADDPPSDLVNKRTARFDLESVYLGGPKKHPHLYDATDPTKFKLDKDAPRDLPRNTNLKAEIGDPRNDENTIISQLHLAFLKFHNQIVDWLKRKDTSLSGDSLFQEAQRLVRWHYQYTVIEQFMRVTLEEETFEDIYRNGPRFVQLPLLKMPCEF
jgi:Animal haem peroxidase